MPPARSRSPSRGDASRSRTSRSPSAASSRTASPAVDLAMRLTEDVKVIMEIHPEGMPSSTAMRVLRRGTLKSDGAGVSLVECRPKTWPAAPDPRAPPGHRPPHSRRQDLRRSGGAVPPLLRGRADRRGSHGAAPAPPRAARRHVDAPPPRRRRAAHLPERRSRRTSNSSPMSRSRGMPVSHDDQSTVKVNSGKNMATTPLAIPV